MKLAIFDLDGTLYNTNDVNYYSYKQALNECGYDIDYDYFCDYCNGRNYKVFIPSIVDNNEEIIEKVHDLKKQYYSKNIDKVIVNEHLFNIIDGIKNEYKIILVTTASKKNTNELLEATGKKEVFEDIITGDDISKPKPDPEGFLLAINKYGAKPEDCIIFEDSEVGIQAAEASGACVMVIDKF
jgi:beta-phosphoglucomutase